MSRGAGKAKLRAFPVGRRSTRRAAAIRATPRPIGAAAGDLGLCGGASGGDLLFAEACLERGMRDRTPAGRTEADSFAESVTFADPDHAGSQFRSRQGRQATAMFVMPQELGPRPRA